MNLTRSPLYLKQKGLGTDEDALIEILIGRSNTEITAIKTAYEKTFDKNLEKEVQSETSGHFRKLLVAVLQANRDETRTNWDVAADVEEFYRAGEKKMGTDESVFISLLVNRPEYHLRTVFEAYRQKYGKGMEEVIKKEFSGDLEKALLGIGTLSSFDSFSSSFHLLTINLLFSLQSARSRTAPVTSQPSSKNLWRVSVPKTTNSFVLPSVTVILVSWPKSRALISRSIARAFTRGLRVRLPGITVLACLLALAGRQVKLTNVLGNNLM